MQAFIDYIHILKVRQMEVLRTSCTTLARIDNKML